MGDDRSTRMAEEATTPDPLLAGMLALVPRRLPLPLPAPVSRSAPSAAETDLAGRPWAGYVLGARLGAGGMATVYRAEARGGRAVALKILHAAAGRTPGVRRRFEAEVRVAATLRHPHVVAILDAGEWEGRPWLAMELLSGGSLAGRLAAWRAAGSPPPPAEALALARQAAHGLAAAHRRRLVHRDVTPANLLLTADGALKVADFGVVRILDDGTRTAPGLVLGTPLYQAPEQGRGEPAQPAADVYGLGAVLYELLTLRPPFPAASPEELAARRDFTAPEPPAALNPAVPEPVQAACLRCLRRDPSARFADGEALAAALDAIAMG